MKRIKVLKEEFDIFVKDYPKKLEVGISRVCEPEIKSYNDSTKGSFWPECEVARIVLGDPKEYYIT